MEKEKPLTEPQMQVLKEVLWYLVRDNDRKIVATELYPELHWTTGRRAQMNASRGVLERLKKLGYLADHPDLPAGCTGWYLITDKFKTHFNLMDNG